MTTQKASWIRTGLQAAMVTVLSTVIINATSMLGEKLTLVINKLDKIDKHDIAISELQSAKSHADSMFTVQAHLNSNRQQSDWELDKKINEIQSENNIKFATLFTKIENIKTK